ncbi:MAG: transglutaminase family protein, partial [Microcystis panniformis]
MHVGYEFGFDAPLPLVMLLKLYLHPSILDRVR